MHKSENRIERDMNSRRELDVLYYFFYWYEK